MNESGLIIVSKPVSKKNRYEHHWIIRTIKDEGELIIEDVIIKGVIVAHASKYEEAERIIQNLINGES